MNDESHELILCNHPDCKASIKNHYWGKVKAEGWLFLKDGRSYCPEHLPEWAKTWRRRR